MSLHCQREGSVDCRLYRLRSYLWHTAWRSVHLPSCLDQVEGWEGAWHSHLLLLALLCHTVDTASEQNIHAVCHKYIRFCYIMVSEYRSKIIFLLTTLSVLMCPHFPHLMHLTFRTSIPNGLSLSSMSLAYSSLGAVRPLLCQSNFSFGSPSPSPCFESPDPPPLPSAKQLIRLGSAHAADLYWNVVSNFNITTAVKFFLYLC